MVITDFCEEAARLAREVAQGAGLECTQPCINPFRSPMRMVQPDNNLPSYPHAFVFVAR